MKLSELKTDEVADVLCEIAPLVDSIVSDEKIMSTVGKGIKKEGKTEIGVAMEALHRLTASVPLLLGTHRADVFGILASVNRQDVETVAAQPIKDTVAQLKELLQDKDFVDFFGIFA